jgi:hypothetical protein
MAKATATAAKKRATRGERMEFLRTTIRNPDYLPEAAK